MRLAWADVAVMVAIGDPVGSGLVASLPRPGTIEVRGGPLTSYGRRHRRQDPAGRRPRHAAVESPRRFELALNEATAKKLGLVFPASVRARANAVIDF